MKRYYDGLEEESMAKGGTYDIQGVVEVDSKKIWGFNAGDTTVVAAIGGVAIGDNTETEVDLLSKLTNDATKALFTNVLYRIPGYIMTTVTLTSGSLHCYLTVAQ